VFVIVFGGLFVLYSIHWAIRKHEARRREEEWLERQLRARERYEEIFRSPYDHEEDNVVDLDSRR
jgi:hypothetical protein